MNIWIEYESKIVCVELSNSIKNKISKLFNLKANINYRLRNVKEHLIPVNESIEVNLRKEPYKLEIYALNRQTLINTSKIQVINFFNIIINYVEGR